MRRANWSTRVGRAFGTLFLLILVGMLVYAISDVAGRVVPGGTFLLLALYGALVAVNWQGVTAEFVTFFWTAQGLRVSAPIAQARIIGAVAVFIGMVGGVGLIVSAFNPVGS